MILLLLFLGAYVLGSIPFAVLIGRTKGIDIMRIGSGNPGMTNVGRALGQRWGLACFVLDIGKGLVPTLLARKLVQQPVNGLDPELLWFAAGFAAILGHCASIFLRFRGGKGVSSALGAIIGTSPVVAALCFALFLVSLFATRYVSVGSIVGIWAVLPLSLALPHESRQLLPIYLLLSLFVLFRHRTNLRRIRQGTEPKVIFPWEKKRVVPETDGATESEPLRDAAEAGAV